VADATRRPGAGARVGARGGLRGAAREDAAALRVAAGRPLGPRRQGRARRREGAGHGAMSRIDDVFIRLRATGERALGPYFTAGDPSLDVTRRLVIEAGRRGADLVELGVPFSDPIADGPVIQRAAARALTNG